MISSLYSTIVRGKLIAAWFLPVSLFRKHRSPKCLIYGVNIALKLVNGSSIFYLEAILMLWSSRRSVYQEHNLVGQQPLYVVVHTESLHRNVQNLQLQYHIEICPQYQMGLLEELCGYTCDKTYRIVTAWSHIVQDIQNYRIIIYWSSVITHKPHAIYCRWGNSITML